MMTILEVLVRLRDDLKLWVTNNLRVKVDKEDGKGLSSNDFTTEEKEKLASIDTYVDEKIQQRIDSLPKGDDGEDGKSAYETAKEGGYTGTEEQFANKLAAITYETSVKEYGAKGDGSTNDTAAFQNALANNRVVDVPGGTYILNDTLVIRQNCRLNFSQDTVLKFTQTNGNCIEMRSSATLSGNHGVISVPYEFAGNVVSSVTTNDETRDTPPYTHWDPQWKRGRYIYDVCIIKPDTNGLCCMRAGSTCTGNGIYLSCDGDSTVRFMWGVMLQGVRIAGAFTNGIKVINYDLEGKEDSAWNHDMRIEAVIEGCETGVSLTNCNGPHLAVTVQPQTAQGGAPYAKWGVYLNDCKFVDMSSSVVWDWNSSKTLYGTNNEYTFVAMYGDCAGLVLYDYAYYRTSINVRDRIHADPASNLDRMTILQEPITKWFKPKAVDNKLIPHFDDGYSEQPLMLQSELKKYFNTQTVNDFDDVLSVATDENGHIFGDKGYIPGRFDSLGEGTTIVTNSDASTYYRVTGFIKCKSGDKFNTRHLSFERQDGYAGVVFYDQNYKRLTSITAGLIANHGWVGAISDYAQTDYGCSFVIGNQVDPEYVRFVFHTSDVGDFPAIAINQDLGDKEYGFLADDIKVDDDNIESIKLNTLQTRVDNMGQYVSESIGKLEASVDDKFKNFTVKTEQLDFILPADGEYVQNPLFTDQLAIAKDKDGSDYNRVGYKTDVRVNSTDGEILTTGASNFIATGFIPCKCTSVIRMENINYDYVSDYTNLVVYDENYNKVHHINRGLIVDSAYYANYTKTDNGCMITFTGMKDKSDVKYVRFTFHNTCFGESPRIAIDEEIKYETEWKGEPKRFDDSLYAQNVLLTSPSGSTFKLTVSDDGVLSATAFIE